MQKPGVATKVLGGFVAFCALALGPMNQASAGCGDYLTIGRGPTMKVDHSNLPTTPATAPCNGPNCHRHDGPPLTPSPDFRAAPPTVKAAAIFATLASSPMTFVERLFDDGDVPLPGHSASILRPPQGARRSPAA
jgi:hypothetical protein